MQKIKYVFFVLIATILSTSCSDEIYTIKECKAFKKGDTIYVKEFYTIEENIVLENNPKMNIIKVRNIKWRHDVDILEYDSFRFK